MKGYKIFDSNWMCRGFQYEVGKTFEEDLKPECGKRGFHFCKSLQDCFGHFAYSEDENPKIAEVEAIGEIDSHKDGLNFCTNKIKIVRELDWLEVLSTVNNGEFSSALFNEGKGNSGSGNTGNNNSGYMNSGFSNTGSQNHGFCNTGNANIGSDNSGDINKGKFNSGNRNEGERNSGYCNTGNDNVGTSNKGNGNVGDLNVGDKNMGSNNIGNRNFGDFNLCSNSGGCFNTKPQKIYLFNKLSTWTFEDWVNSRAYKIIEELGIIKRSLTDEETEIIKSIPNFDKEIFEKIMGIKIG